MDVAAATDQQLIDEAGTDSPHAERAFAELYNRHRDFVFRVARRSGADEHAAWDAVQETFIRLAREIGTGRVRVQTRLTTYLFPIARNIAVTHLRKVNAARRAAHRAAETALTSTVCEAVNGELAAAMARALDALPEAQRDVLVLRILDNMQLDEIGIALAIPLGTVKSRLHHAIRSLETDPQLRGFLPKGWSP